MEALDRQQYDFDCGPAALHGALKLYGRKYRYQDIRRWAGTTPEKGTSAAGIKRVLDRLQIPYSEFQSKSRKVSWDWARRQTQPVVLSFDQDEHWVLLCAGLGRRVMVFDPESGMGIYSRKDFLARWVTDGRVYGILLKRA